MASATRYQPRQLLWLLAIRRLRTTERLTLSEIRTRLQALSAPELEAFATENLTPGALTEALGIRTATPPAAPTSEALLFAPHAESGDVSSPHIPRWARLELALGLELHIRDDASARVLALARRLRDFCAGSRDDAMTT